MALYLGLDTASPFLALALWAPEGVHEVFCGRVEREHAERIIPALERLFHRAEAEPRELSGIGVGIGPGSYTGLRVGLATARGLARGLGVPLRGCSTLAAIAHAHLEDGETGVAALDARRGNLYAGVFRREKTMVLTLEAVGKRPKAELELTYPDTRLIEGAAPDPVYIARAALETHGTQASALYL